jgi:hypothetical protein
MITQHNLRPDRAEWPDSYAPANLRAIGHKGACVNETINIVQHDSAKPFVARPLYALISALAKSIIVTRYFRTTI